MLPPGRGLIEEILNEIAAHCGTGLQKVEAFIHSYATVMTVNFGRCVMRLDEGDLTSDARAEVRTYKRKIDRRLRSFIQEGIEDGSIAPCDPKIAAFSIAGALNWICMWYEPDGALSPEEIATSVRAHVDARVGRQKAEQQVAHSFQRGVIRMSVEAAIKPAAAGARLRDRAPSTVIRKAAVLGAGTMGSRIAAHLANAGLPVVLLDIPAKDGARSAIAVAGAGCPQEEQAGGVLRSRAMRRASRVGNFDDDLALLADCDWVIEAVTENLAIKQALLDKVVPHLKPDAILTTNTSGLPVASIAAEAAGDGAAALVRHALLQSAALHAAGGDHSHAGGGPGGDGRHLAILPTCGWARKWCSRATRRTSSPTGSASSSCWKRSA